MTFLAPWAGVLGAAIAVPVLLLLYLLRLRRRPLRVSSTLLWEQAAQNLQVNVPLRMLRWSSLLALHLLALACLLLALARPAIGEGGVAGSRIVIVIDRSASMNATDMSPSALGGAGGPPRSRLDAARERAIDLLDSIGRSGAGGVRPRCMLIAMADRPDALTGFTPDLRLLKEAIAAIKPSDQPDNLPETLGLIEAMTAEGGNEEEGGGGAAPPTVYLVTDGVIEPLSDQRARATNARLVHLIVEAGAKPESAVDNAGIVAVSARFDVDDAGLVRVFARLINASPSSVDLAVRCTIDGEVPTDGVLGISLPGARTAPDGSTVPGEAAAVFALRPAPSTLARTIVVSINRADVLSADDAAGLVLPPPWRARVLVVAPDGTPPTTEPVPDLFLLQALEAAEPASIRVIGASALAPGLWATADVVIFDRVAPGVLPPLPSLSFGAALPIPGLSIVAAEALGSPDGAARALAWQRDHASLRYVGLDTLTVAPAAAINLPVSDTGPESATRRYSILIDGTVGPLMLGIEEGVAGERPTRRLVVAFDLARSNWGPDVSFPVFMGNALEYLTAGRSGTGTEARAVSFTTIDRVRVDVPAGTRVVRASGAADRTLELAGDFAAARTVQVGPLERAGVYRLQTDDGRSVDPAAVVVNLASERESTMARRVDAASPTGVVIAPAGLEAGPREVWHWFILAALALLTLEWFVYAWRMRG